jgi:hypothetical protein
MNQRLFYASLIVLSIPLSSIWSIYVAVNSP